MSLARMVAGLIFATVVVVVLAWFAANPNGGADAENGHPEIEETVWPYTDADFRSDHWISVLGPKRGPAEIIFSTKARRSWGAANNLLVDSRSPAFLELGRTVSRSYSIELIYTAENWKGHSGLFIGYRPMANDVDLAEATLLSISELEPGRAALDISRIELQRGGEQFPKSIKHSRPGKERVPLKAGKSVAITVQVADGKIVRLYQNNAQLDDLPLLADPEYPCSGQFGVFTLGGSCNFQHCRIRITPEEN